MTSDKVLKAQCEAAIAQIKSAIVELLDRNPDGMGNSEIANSLGLESSPGVKSQRNYLSYAILQELVAEGKVHTLPGKAGKRYTIAKSH